MKFQSWSCVQNSFSNVTQSFSVNVLNGLSYQFTARLRAISDAFGQLQDSVKTLDENFFKYDMNIACCIVK